MLGALGGFGVVESAKICPHLGVKIKNPVLHLDVETGFFGPVDAISNPLALSG